MAPHAAGIHPSDIVALRPASSTSVGDVVAHSQLLHRVVLHRIVAIHNGHYTFKGRQTTGLSTRTTQPAPNSSASAGYQIPSVGRLVGILHTPPVLAALPPAARRATWAGRRRPDRRPAVNTVIARRTAHRATAALQPPGLLASATTAIGAANGRPRLTGDRQRPTDRTQSANDPNAAGSPLATTRHGANGQTQPTSNSAPPPQTTCNGKAGADCIIGGAGDDTINGGGGADICIGGPGTDTFTNCATSYQ